MARETAEENKSKATKRPLPLEESDQPVAAKVPSITSNETPSSNFLHCCKICTKTFLQPFDLYLHLDRVHGYCFRNKLDN